MNEPWFCYLVRCKDDSLYVGVATDVDERIRRHNQGFGAAFTARRRPVELLWKKQYPNQRSARVRERELKGWRREKKLQLVRFEGLKAEHSASDRTLRPLARLSG